MLSGLARDDELAGDPSLMDAGGEQLAGAEPALHELVGGIGLGDGRVSWPQDLFRAGAHAKGAPSRLWSRSVRATKPRSAPAWAVAVETGRASQLRPDGGEQAGWTNQTRQGTPSSTIFRPTGHLGGVAAWPGSGRLHHPAAGLGHAGGNGVRHAINQVAGGTRTPNPLPYWAVAAMLEIGYSKVKGTNRNSATRWMADPIPDPKRTSTGLLPVASIAIEGVRGDVSSRSRP
jgi:hypothetical protein